MWKYCIRFVKSRVIVVVYRGDFNVDGKTLDTLRKELREFTNNKQRQLEDERTDLLARNTMLTEEVEILQKTVDTELKRYLGVTLVSAVQNTIIYVHTVFFYGVSSSNFPPSLPPQIQGGESSAEGTAGNTRWQAKVTWYSRTFKTLEEMRQRRESHTRVTWGIYSYVHVYIHTPPPLPMLREQWYG